METLVLNGKEYVKASKAAKDLGYASDYVGQLCRGGSVDAHLVGRTWYVNPDTLTTHKVEKKRNARVKAREYAKKAIEETRSLKLSTTKNNYKNIAIHYEDDQKDLIPSVRKLPVETNIVTSQNFEEVENDTSLYKIENENNKIIMSGVLNIEDADVETIQSDTVLLTPNFRKAVKKKNHDLLAAESPINLVEEKTLDSQPSTQPTFVQRLDQLREEETRKLALYDTVETSNTAFSPAEPKRSFMLHYFIVLLILILCGLSVFAEQKFTANTVSVVSDYSLNFEILK